ncbi:unnamed protein product [Rhizophagus irregularis]|nr:unnamed protein product [Rhizophagus irregularis]
MSNIYKIISSFFKTKSYKEWSIIACLQFISENAPINFEDRESILDDMKRKVKSISNNQNILSHARNKASSIYSSFDKTAERREVRDLFERIEKKTEFESRKLLYRESMKIENLNDKWEVAPDTRLTKELETNDERATKRTKSDKDSNDDHDNEDNLLPFSKSGENLSNDESEIPTNSGNLVMTQVHRSIQETNVIVHNKFNSLVESQVASKKEKLSEADADGQFEMITHDTAVKTDIPNDIKAYLCDLLSGDIESTLSKVEKPLELSNCNGNATLSTFAAKKLGQAKRYIVFLTCFQCFLMNWYLAFRLVRLGDRNDAVICQDENATILYEQSFGPTEFDETHYLGDMTKLARNGVDDINYQFLQYRKSSITTAKKLKSIGIHGYKYFISIYLTDLISCKTYRIYEIFKCKILTSYSDRWFLMDIVKIGVLLEALLVERKSIKEKMCKEHNQRK